MENHPTDILANYQVKAMETVWYWQRNLRKTSQKDIPEIRVMHICGMDMMKIRLLCIRKYICVFTIRRINCWGKTDKLTILKF